LSRKNARPKKRDTIRKKENCKPEVYWQALKRLRVALRDATAKFEFRAEESKDARLLQAIH